MLKIEPPKLVKLRYGNPYCEDCRDPLEAGMLVAWWRVRSPGGEVRKAVVCAACHHGRIGVNGRKRKRR